MRLQLIQASSKEELDKLCAIQERLGWKKHRLLFTDRTIQRTIYSRILFDLLPTGQEALIEGLSPKEAIQRLEKILSGKLGLKDL